VLQKKNHQYNTGIKYNYNIAERPSVKLRAIRKFG